MDIRSALESLVKTTPQRHTLAEAFLAYRSDDENLLTKIAQTAGFIITTTKNIQAWEQGGTPAFYLSILRDPTDPEELTDLLTTAHSDDLLPLLIVQYSNDPTDNRGDNVFDIYISTKQLAIAHANRVYTKRK